MSENYFDLSDHEKREILQAASHHFTKSEIILEKDIWICLILKLLFSMPNHNMAFKGGTSLSKIYGMIDRFSEDIDITINYQYFTDFPNPKNKKFDPFDPNSTPSKRQIDKFSDYLKQQVAEHVRLKVVPHLINELDQLALNHLEIEIQPDNPECVSIYYPSVVNHSNHSNNYLKEYILLEFGGRNATTPSQNHTIRPYIAEITTGLDLPTCNNITVLSSERTYWEKITLAHSECNRKSLKQSYQKISRHWYDIEKISHYHPVNKLTKDLLHEVIRIKKTFYKTSFSNYDDCLRANIQLVPTGEILDQLCADYVDMQNSGMLPDNA
ncbi:nucleotidyl transferase AbiEii/AbiGii toxin family protein [Cysteiniphilum sp. 6C5]|uniref:nucleotidyl transferase AbiEii/AbiGii toxin family protein n=1 Tax=unclassified Cysteiniphilum TaxID=2610889 RepID=UPI003F843B11